MNLVRIATERPVTIFMATAAILMFGYISLSRLAVNLLPEMSYPTLTIRTEFEGAAPAEVEQLITRPIEERLGVVSDVRKLSSISTAGQSDVVLEFNWGTNMDAASVEVREKLDLVGLPQDVERPTILRLNPALDPIVRVALGSRSDDPAQTTDSVAAARELRRFGEDAIKRLLDPVSGLAAVRVSGGFEEEVHIHVDQHKMSQFGLSIEQLSARLRTTNVNMAGGSLTDGTQDFLVRTVNEYQSIEQMRETIIARKGNSIVRLRDVAQVDRGYKDREAITRVNGIESVEIAIYKEGDANTVEVARDITRMLTEIRRTLPSRYQLVTIYDQSTFIVEAIDEVQSAAILGGLLAVLVLYFFLRDFRATLIISLSIPVSVMATFAAMNMNEITLNIMSLGGIALAVGLLVDNSIVVLENIAAHKETGVDPVTAAREGTSEVSAAVVASTATTVAVFLPLVFVEGIAGQLFKDQALTVTYALLTSLLVALTLIPMLSSLGRKDRSADPAPEPSGKGLRQLPLTMVTSVAARIRRLLKLFQRPGRMLLRLFDATYRALARGYSRLLRASLSHPAVTLITAIAVSLASTLVIPLLGMELIPAMSQGEYKGDLKFPAGTALSTTDEVLQKAGLQMLDWPLIERTYSVAGSGGRLDASAAAGGENIGELNIVLRPGFSEAGEQQTLAALRDYFSAIPEAEIRFSRPSLFTLSTPLQIEIAGYNQDTLRDFAERLQRLLEQSPTFTDIESTAASGYPEIQIIFDHDRAARLNLDVSDIASTVVRAIRGDVATEYSWQDKKIDVRIQTGEADRSSVEDVGNLIVNPASERPVRLSSVARIEVNQGPAEIHRIGQQRVAVVSANVADGDLGRAAQEVRRMLREIPQPDGIAPRVSGQNEEMEASFDSLILALVLAVFMVYLVMASLFESFLHPFVILFSVPLAFVGAVLALYLSGTTLSVVVFIGFILLAGIVVNNAIVLIDRINQIRARGVEKRDAIIAAGEQRFRPIIMTTLTTVLGLAPMAFGAGEAGEVRAPMAVTVIGGLSVSTLLTLVVIPVLYQLLDRKTIIETTAEAHL